MTQPRRNPELAKAIKLAGGASALADELGVRPQQMYKAIAANCLSARLAIDCWILWELNPAKLRDPQGRARLTRETGT